MSFYQQLSWKIHLKNYTKRISDGLWICIYCFSSDTRCRRCNKLYYTTCKPPSCNNQELNLWKVKYSKVSRTQSLSRFPICSKRPDVEIILTVISVLIDHLIGLVSIASNYKLQLQEWDIAFLLWVSYLVNVLLKRITLLTRFIQNNKSS